MTCCVPNYCSDTHLQQRLLLIVLRPPRETFGHCCAMYCTAACSWQRWSELKLVFIHVSVSWSDVELAAKWAGRSVEWSAGGISLIFMCEFYGGFNHGVGWGWEVDWSSKFYEVYFIVLLNIQGELQCETRTLNFRIKEPSTSWTAMN